MIQLPSKPDQSLLLCFWLSLCFVTGLMIWTVSTYLISIKWPLLGLISICLFFLIGLVHPKIIPSAYKNWNKATGLFARISRFCLLAVCFYIVLIFAGRTAAFMNLKRPATNKSMWSPWIASATEIYSRQGGDNHPFKYKKNWIFTFISWANKPRHLWAFSLLPFIILLRALQTDRRSDFPTKIYTLY